MGPIFRREFHSYFTTPIGYVFIGVFLAISGFFFSYYNIAYRYPQLDETLYSITLWFLFLVPILTMGLLSEERKNKTDQLLLTSPVSVREIVLGKFFAAVCIYLISILLTLLYLVVISIHGEPSYPAVFCSYLGFILLDLCFISVGIFVSSLTESQIISAVVTFCICLALYLIDWLSASVSAGWLLSVIKFFSLTARFEEFNIGILNLEPIVFYLSFITVFLFLTVRSVERRRWF